MGIGPPLVRTLLQLKERQLLPGSPAVVEMGAQQMARTCFGDMEALARVGRAFGATGPCPIAPGPAGPILDGGLEHLDPASPSAREFWVWLGFHHLSVDVEPGPHTLVLDLNYDDVPDPERGQYDLVTNCGTTEHVANQLNAFKVMHDLAAPGGVFFHEVPTQGMINHGLVNYNPKFFWMLARSNDYEFISTSYDSTTERYALPDNLVEFVSRYLPDFRVRSGSYDLCDAGLRVVLRKRHARAFVPPIDASDAALAAHSVLRQRYGVARRLHPGGRLATVGRKMARRVARSFMRRPR